MYPVRFDASRRVLCTTLAGGTVPTVVENGIAYNATGRVLFNPDAPAGSVVLNVNRIGPNQNIYRTTSTAGNDVFVNGFRYSTAGALVCADGGAVVTVVNGLGSTRTARCVRRSFKMANHKATGKKVGKSGPDLVHTCAAFCWGPLKSLSRGQKITEILADADNLLKFFGLLLNTAPRFGHLRRHSLRCRSAHDRWNH
jgi:hypothetical protein